jgi:peptidoglycan/xylan/chitin deacetylase (PgdA/CDA1 family)
MASGRWTTLRAEVGLTTWLSRALVGLAVITPLTLQAQSQRACTGPAMRPVYLTLDTGHMGVAPLMAEVLQRHAVPVTFFAAQERSMTGDGSLGEAWTPWWKARAAEGHAFASHTFDHTYWRADLPPSSTGEPRFRVRPSAGPDAGLDQVWTASQYCAEIRKADKRLQAVTGQKPLPLFRAPGGKTSPALIKAAEACGYAHVGWSPAGFLGDELPSERFPNQQLLSKALKDIRAGDILVAHLGIWSRKDAWAPAVLEPLIVGLKARGFCFATLREHPDFKPWIASHP